MRCDTYAYVDLYESHIGDGISELKGVFEFRVFHAYPALDSVLAQKGVFLKLHSEFSRISYLVPSQVLPDGPLTVFEIFGSFCHSFIPLLVYSVLRENFLHPAHLYEQCTMSSLVLRLVTVAVTVAFGFFLLDMGI
jgi:hypothetical protein